MVGHKQQNENEGQNYTTIYKCKDGHRRTKKDTADMLVGLSSNRVKCNHQRDSTMQCSH